MSAAPNPNKTTGTSSALPLAFALALVAVFAFLGRPVAASNAGLAVTLGEQVPAAGWSGSFDFTIACDTDGEIIAAPTATTGAGSTSLSCWVDGTTPVFFGSSSTMVTTANGIPVCEDAACANGSSAPAIWRSPLAKRGIFGCIVTSGTVTIRCNGVTP